MTKRVKLIQQAIAELMVNVKEDKIIEELFQSLFSRYSNGCSTKFSTIRTFCPLGYFLALGHILILGH